MAEQWDNGQLMAQGKDWATALARFSTAGALGFWFVRLIENPNAGVMALTVVSAAIALLVWQLPVSYFQTQTSLADKIEESKGYQSARSESVDFDALPLPILVVDRSARILSSNMAALAEFGSIESGTQLFMRFRAADMRQAFQMASIQHQPAHFEMHEKVPIERWMRVDVCPMELQPSAEASCVIMFRDISEGRKLDRIRSDFVANASHELRTPLASISGFIDTLRGPARSDEKARDQFLGIMQEQAGRMSRLIDDLLSLSRLEMRSMTDDAELLDLSAVTKEAIDSLRPVAAENGVEIQCVIQAGSNSIRGIRDEIIQMIENLVENACKYGKSGKRVQVEIKRQNRDEPKEIMLSVRDFGPGIAPEHIPRLTERFYRANNGSSPSAKGTGLGLAIVKHIVSRHRGRLTIASNPGKGSIFAIYLPANDGGSKSGDE